jgi:hypothetical protein
VIKVKTGIKNKTPRGEKVQERRKEKLRREKVEVRGRMRKRKTGMKMERIS